MLKKTTIERIMNDSLLLLQEINQDVNARKVYGDYCNIEKLLVDGQALLNDMEKDSDGFYPVTELNENNCPFYFEGVN
jgi:hypothetical protein